MKFTVKKDGKLVKETLKEFGDLSYSNLFKLLRKKDIKVNGKRVSKDISVFVGDLVEIYYVPEEKDKFSVIFKDENITVINKFSGYTSEEVYESLLKENKTARFIHRLDRNTSGIMVFALNDDAERELLDGFKKRTFTKYYTATVIGCPKEKEKILTAYLIKDAENSTVKIYDKKTAGGVKIATGYKVIESDGETSTLKVRLYTGKTHQIRAHLAHIGHPIVGDGKYGDNAYNKTHKVKSQKLSATELVLTFKENSPLYYLSGKEFKI